ncbi:hypothetical protein ACFL20_00510 [Spirochaetota bacterium]
MKKIFISIFIAAVTFTSASAEQQGMESITPSEAILFLKTSKISRLVQTSKFIIDNILSEKQKLQAVQGRDSFRKKTGIDLLEVQSIGSKGLNTDKRMGLAILKKVNNRDRLIIFIPVIDGKSFPLKFVEIIKSINMNKGDLDIYPAITMYKNNRIYQMRKDVFATSSKGYFVIASTGKLIKNVVDLADDSSKSLASDTLYADYLKNKKGHYDFNFFVKREMLIDIFKRGLLRRKKRDNIKKPSLIFNDKNIYGAVLKNKGEMDESYRMVQFSKKRSGGVSPFESVNYALLGAGVESNRFKVYVGADLNVLNPLVNIATSLIKTGNAGKSLYLQDATGYSFLSLNFKDFEKICKTSGPGCKEYVGLKKAVKMETGIDLAVDFIPYYSGIVNVLLGKSEGFGMNNIAAYLPMNSYAKSKALWLKAKKYFKSKYVKSKGFGETKINGKNVFWFAGKDRQRRYFYADKRGIYIADKLPFLKTIIKSKELGEVQISHILIEKMTKDVFFLAYVKDKSFLNNLMKMQTMRNRDIGSAVARIGDIFIILGGKKNLFTVELDVELNKKIDK